MTAFKNIWIEHKKFGGLWKDQISKLWVKKKNPKVDVTEPTREDHSNTLYSQS